MATNTNIEREIVQLSFDAKEFQTGVRDSLKELEEFKKGLHLGKVAEEAFAQVQKASRVDFAPILEGISSINSKLSVLGVIGAKVISDLTGSIISNAKKLFDTLVVAPVTTGLEEYETQLNAVQTILANTAKHGTSLKDVTGALDTLNTYADLTIYNFTQMVDSIGKFTTAGVDLDTSVSAIKGIANVAAVSGSNAQQASTAMYQLSQAISSGVVRLQDWISVENAGMGGEIFKESLIETARVHGVAIDKILEDEEGFRNSLKSGWLSSEILLETLSKFTGDLSDAQLQSMGYSEEQIAGILKMAETANDAATKIKTLTQLKDTLSEALQSGWSETWRIIFGDFEEAKELWGAMGDLFGDMIANSSESRNSMLKYWDAFGGETGGRTALIKGVFNLIEAGSNILKTFGEGIQDIFRPINAHDLIAITEGFLSFSEKLKEASENSEWLRTIVRGLAAAFDIVLIVIKAVLKPIRALLSGMGPAADSFLTTALSISDAIVAFREFALETGFFDTVVASVIEYVGELIDKIKELVQEFLDLDIVEKVVSWFKGLEKSDFVRVWDGILKVVQAIIAPFYLLAVGARKLYEEIVRLEIVRKISDYFNSIDWEGIKKQILGFGDGIKEFVEGLKESELLEKFINYIKTFDGRRLTNFLDDARESFGWVGTGIDAIREKLGGFHIDFRAIGKGIAKFAKTIGEHIGEVFQALTDSAGTADYTKFFDVLNAGLLGGVLISLRNLVKGGFIGGILEKAFGGSIESLSDAASGAFGAMESTLVSFQNNIKADTLQKVAISIAILAGSIALFTLIDETKLLAATAAIATMIAALFGASGALKFIDQKSAVQASIAMVGLSISIGIMAKAMNNLKDMDPDQLETALLGMAAGLAGLVLSIRGLGEGSSVGILKTVGTLLGLALAIRVMSGALVAFGTLEPDVLQQGLVGISSSLGILTTAMLVLSKVGNKGILKASLAINAMALALGKIQTAVGKFGGMDPDILTQGLLSVGAVLVSVAGWSRLLDKNKLLQASIGIGVASVAVLVLQKAIESFGGMSWEELLRGLAGVAGGLLLIALAANAMTGAATGAFATAIMAGAIIVLAGALKLLSTLTWEDLLIGLAAIAGVFVVLGAAGALLTPVVPTLIALGAAMILIGAGAALFGLGMFLAATGLVAIAGASVAIGAAIKIIAEAIIEVLPAIGEAIANALTNFLVTISENTPIIIEAMKSIILGMIEGATTLIPDIVQLIADLITDILQTIADALPDIVQAGFDILLAILQGIEDNIAEVVSTALGIISEFIDGIADGLPDIVDSGFNLLVTFLNSIADGIEENMEDIVAAGLRIGEGIIDGLVDAIGGGLEAVWQAVKDLAAKALGALAEAFGLHSPSKETYAQGLLVIQGLVNSFRDSVSTVRRVIEEVAQEVQNGIQPLTSIIADSVDDELSISPIVTPVLELDGIRSGLGRLNRSYTNVALLGRISSDNRDQLTTTQQGVSDRGEVTYIQNNYSPRALDAATIYRKTKSQVGKLRLATS